MRVYQFRHVGNFTCYSALPPRSAIILAFEVLRQTNFRYSPLSLLLPTCCIFFRCDV